MKLSGFFSAVALASLPFALLACGGGDDGGGGGGAPDAAPACTAPEGDHTYVMNAVLLPRTINEAVSLYGLDIDGKAGDSQGGVDNVVGSSLASLGAVDIDVATTVSTAVADGTIILLANLRADSLTNTSCADVSVYLGEQADPAPCADENDTECGRHLQGDASFVVSADSPDDATVGGRIIGGAFSVRAGDVPGSITLELPAVEGVDPIAVNLIGAQIAIESVSEDGLMQGVIGGAVEVSEIENSIIPALQQYVTTLLADCTDAAPNCCPADSTGAQALEILDENMDCTVSNEEIATNQYVELLLDPDMDLLDASGNFAPNTDGEDDSLSLGLGFTATTATFTVP
ncbi:MAG: hypothetical protein Tsb0020_41230 [Haliangiales bacterium]